MTEQILLDAPALSGKIAEVADAMAGMIGDPKHAAIIGIRTRGAILARRVQSHLKQSRGWDLPLGALDITLYRDDISQLGSHPLVRGTNLPFDVEGKMILLIDDVLYTGRTIRCALDQIIDFGRPRAVKLAVLVDRGLREYPIQADFAALTLQTTPDQSVQVHLAEQDNADRVTLTQPTGS